MQAPSLRPGRSFERLYRRHAADVYRYALAVLRDPADAEDVAQTTFLNAYRAYQRGERPDAPRNWLIAIAHNVCRQRFRQAQRRVPEVSLDETVAEALVRDEDAPSAEDIRRALGQLAFNQRTALVMRELEGRSYAEIAEALGLSLSAVETLIFRARRALREQLEGGLTCDEAERSISRQLDGRLQRAARGPLRAHLRECEPCASLARRMRAQRSAVRALGLVPLPASLASLFGGGAAAGAGGAVAMKAAAVVAAAAVVGGAGHEAAQRVQRPAAEQVPAAALVAAPAPAAAPVGARIAPPAKAEAPPRALPAPPAVAVAVRPEPPAAAKPKKDRPAGGASSARPDKPAKPLLPPQAAARARQARPASTPAPKKAKAKAARPRPVAPVRSSRPDRPERPERPQRPEKDRSKEG